MSPHDAGLLLPVYLMALAAFMLFINLKAGSGPGKWVSYVAMWASIFTSLVVALVVYP